MTDLPSTPAVRSARAAARADHVVARLSHLLGDDRPRQALTRSLQVRHAVDSLRTYAGRIGNDQDPVQVERLLWALAAVERTLWCETGGLVGCEHSNALSVLERLVTETPTGA